MVDQVISLVPKAAAIVFAVGLFACSDSPAETWDVNASCPDTDGGECETSSRPRDGGTDGESDGCRDPSADNLVCCNDTNMSYEPTCRDGQLVCERSGYSLTERLFCESRPDARDGTGADTGDTSGRSDPWVRHDRCDGEVTYDEPSRSFEVPEREHDDEVHTLEKFRGRWTREEDDFPEAAVSPVPDESLEPGPNRAWDLYAREGQDVTFHMAYVINPDKMSHPGFEGKFISVAFLVDYEPVKFEYKIWGDEHEEVLDSGKTTGLRRPFDGHAKIIDITIPAAVFSEHRMYEVSSVSAFEVNRGLVWVPTARYALYHEGMKRPTHRCFDPPLGGEINDAERFFYTHDEFHGYYRFGEHPFLLFPDRVRDEAAAGNSDAIAKYPDTYKVEPGESVEMNLTVARWAHTGFDEPIPAVLMPLVDGKPTGKKWYITFRAGDPDRRFHLHARKRFTFEAPEEPGIYNVMATAWPDPYQPAYEGLPDQKEKNTDVIQETDGLSSNIVRVEVVGKD